MLGMCSVWAASETALAQESVSRGSISGYVKDSSGALVVSATITITNTDTGVTSHVETNGSGYYELRQLIPGMYNVETQSQGFAPLQQTGIHLDAGQTVRVDSAMRAGGANVAVEVKADAVLLNTQEGNNPSVIDSATLQTTPLPDNNPGLMVKLQQGIQSTDPLSSAVTGSMWSNGGNSSFGVNGMYKMSSFTLDGAPNDIHLHQQNYAAAVDEVKEVMSEAAGFDATVGHTLGANQNIVSMNGTNNFHGTLRAEYEDLRWQPLNRTNRLAYINNTKVVCASPNETSAACRAAQTKYGQLGLHNLALAGSIGGPVIIPHLFNGRQKLFFFFDYMRDAIPLVSTGQSTVPTTQQLTGDFSDLPCVVSQTGMGTPAAPYVDTYSAGSCPSRNPALGWGKYQIYDPLATVVDTSAHGGYYRGNAPFAGNIVPLGRQKNPLATYLAKHYMSPNTPDSSGSLADTNNLTYAKKRPQNYYSYAPRIDYALSERNHFFFRYAIGHWESTSPDTSTIDNLGQNFSGRNNFVATAAWDHIFSPNLTVTTTLSYNRYKGPNAYTNSPGTSASLGLPSYLDDQANAFLPVNAPATASISGYATPAFNANLITNYVKSSSANVDFIGVFGKHNVKFGGAYRVQVGKNINLGGSSITAGGNANGSSTLTYDQTYTDISSNSSSFISTGATTLGPSYAAFLMGFNTSATQQVGLDDNRSNPYTAAYVQDTWHITPKLTLNAGLRFEYEWGPTEILNRQLGEFDPTQQIAFAGNANSAYAATNYSAASTALGNAGLPAALPSSLHVTGGATYAGVNGVSTKQWQDSYRFLPRIAAAYSVTSKTVLRGGYGLFYDALNNLNEGNDQIGYSATTTQPSSLAGGTTWVAPGVSSGSTIPTLNPFPNGFASPIGNSGGNLVYAGGSETYFPYNLVPARQQRWQASVQHQMGSNNVITVIYSGAYTSKINGYGAGTGASGPAIIGVNLNAVPGDYYTAGQTPASVQNVAVNTIVKNPFYIANLSSLTAAQRTLLSTGSYSSFFNSATTSVAQLLKPYPHMSGITEIAPVGETKFQQIDATFNRRFTNNFNLNVDYQRSFQYDRDWFANPYDQLPSWEDSQTNSRPSRLVAMGTYKLPFGSGQRLLNLHDWKNLLAGGWQSAFSMELQQGPLIIFPNAFYSGCTTDWQTCDTSNLKLKHPTYGRWFDTSRFNTTSSPTAYNKRVFPHVVDGVRSDGVNNWNINIMKATPIRNDVTFEMRLEALDIFNHLVAASPNTSPTSTQFGQVTGDVYTYGRWVQIQGRIYF